MGQLGGGVRHGEDGPGLARRAELGEVDNLKVLLLSDCGVEAMGNVG